MNDSPVGGNAYKSWSGADDATLNHFPTEDSCHCLIIILMESPARKPVFKARVLKDPTAIQYCLPIDERQVGGEKGEKPG